MIPIMEEKVLLPPLSLRDGSPMEYHFILSLDGLIKEINGDIKKQFLTENNEPTVLEKKETSLVLIQIGSSWGSGIIVSSDGCMQFFNRFDIQTQSLKLFNN